MPTEYRFPATPSELNELAENHRDSNTAWTQVAAAAYSAYNQAMARISRQLEVELFAIENGAGPEGVAYARSRAAYTRCHAAIKAARATLAKALDA